MSVQSFSPFCCCLQAPGADQAGDGERLTVERLTVTQGRERGRGELLTVQSYVKW